MADSIDDDAICYIYSCVCVFVYFDINRSKTIIIWSVSVNGSLICAVNWCALQLNSGRALKIKPKFNKHKPKQRQPTTSKYRNQYTTWKYYCILRIEMNWMSTHVLPQYAPRSQIPFAKSDTFLVFSLLIRSFILRINLF